MAYASWSVVFGEQPSAAKWNILGTNDASFNDGTGLNSGAVQQVAYNEVTAVATGSTVIPKDDTIPQNTEGVQYMTQAITPKASANILVIEFIGEFAFSASATDIIVALFQDSTANALAAVSQRSPGANNNVVVPLKHTMTAGTTSSTTFKIRAGSADAGTTTFNGSSAARIFGGVCASVLKITEYKA